MKRVPVDRFGWKLKNYYRNTGWLNFYVKIRFPLAIAVLIWGIFSSYVQLVAQWDGNFLLIALTLAAFVLDITGLGLNCVAFTEMRKLTPQGYRLNNILMVYGLVCNTLTMAISHITQGPVTMILYSLGAAALMGLVWVWPNMVYFHKRKDLFTGLDAPDAFPPAYYPLPYLAPYQGWN